jgi:putative nucleotidyltransferase with HDIG domain
MHSMNVCTLAVAMAQIDEINPATLQIIATAALLHDVGKTRVTLDILNKPGKFEPEELAEMRKHADYSGDILREEGGFTEEAIAIATQHHEMMDGSGYPRGLKGEEIHPFARITAVADVYDALTAKRIYKDGMPMHQALLIILKNRGTEFDEHAVELLVKTVGFYPVASLVALSTGEMALVYQPNPDNPRQPTLGILTNQKQALRATPYIVDLSRADANGREILKVLDPEEHGIDIEEKMQEIAERGTRTDARSR